MFSEVVLDGIIILLFTQVHPYSVAMEKTWGVEFRNVGSCYFPQSRVDCHYTINPQHTWASNDWIGLFKVRDRAISRFFSTDVTLLLN